MAGLRHAFACLPRAAAAAYLRELDAGHLDAVIEAYLAASASGRRLMRHEQTRTAGLWDEVGPGLGLLPAEPDPRTGRFEPPAPDKRARAGKAGPDSSDGSGPARPLKPPSTEARPGKLAPPPPAPPPPPPEQPTPQTSPSPPPRPPIIRYALPFGVLAAVVAAAVVVVASVFGGESIPAASPSHTPTPLPTVSSSETPESTPVIALEPTAEPTETPRPTATLRPPEPTPTLPPTTIPTEPPGPTAVPTLTPTPSLTLTPTPTQVPVAAPVIRNLVCPNVDRNFPASCQVFMGDQVPAPLITSASFSAQGGSPASGSIPLESLSFSVSFPTAGAHMVTVSICSAPTSCAMGSVIITVF